MNNNILRNILGFVIVFLIVASILSLINLDGLQGEDVDEVDVTKLVQYVENEQVKKLSIDDTKVEIELKEGGKAETTKEVGQPISELLTSYGVEPEKITAIEEIEIKGSSWLDGLWGPLLSFLPLILLFGFLFFMARNMQRGASRGFGIGQSSARNTNETKNQPKKRRTTFKDVAGSKEAKEELTEIVEFLKQPKKFRALGARVPKGALLVGPPGTGKTLLARAVAGEAEVPFFHISGSEFVEMFVGVGASRVRDLFKKAKKNSPAIIFIDEMDAVGRKRGIGYGGSNDEREQTLNQILVEMDGFELDTNVIVLAATNRPDVLDKALMRPGRFDRQIVIDRPNIEEREEILKIHASNKPLEKDVDLHKIAARTSGMTGADLYNLLNEAAILAARHGHKKVNMDMCIEAIEKVMIGPARKSRLLSEEEKKITAYHEAGHAIVAHVIPEVDPVHKISIISRGPAAGYTLNVPDKDRTMHNKSKFLGDISTLLAGHAAETMFFGEVTTGASNDMQRASAIARSMVKEWGMNEKMGPMVYGERERDQFLGQSSYESRNYSEEVAKQIDEEVRAIISGGYDRTQQILEQHRAKLEEISKILLEKETIEKEEFEELMGE